METPGSYHRAVMIQDVVRSLACRPGAIYVDGTAGGGGHARAILEASSPDGLLIGIDRDEDALSECGKALEAFGGRKILVQGNFADMEMILAQLGIDRVDGIVLDLGVSSHQLETAERGFSFSADAPLDMRMDRSGPVTARDLVNGLPERELARILRDWGEERKAARIARAIASRRKVSPIETTGELASIVTKAAGAAPGRKAIHPATRTFQALRIAVNDELDNLRRALRGAVPDMDIIMVDGNNIDDLARKGGVLNCMTWGM